MKRIFIGLLVWAATTVMLPLGVFVGPVMAGQTLGSQIARRELVLVAAALAAPAIGGMLLLPGEITVPRAVVFALGFVDIVLGLFFYFGISSTSSPVDNLCTYSWSIFAVAAGVSGSGVVIVVATED